MTDKEFDLYLEETIDAPPPIDLSGAFTPWRSAMSRILWGTGLTTLTLNFWNLDVILPAIGWMMLFLGYRTLRKENRWFALGYGISWVRILWWLTTFAINATVYSCEPQVKDFLSAMSYAMVIPGFGSFLALRNGIRAVQKKAGLRPHGGNGLLVWYIIFLILALYHYQGLLGWVVIIVYLCILGNLRSLSRELDEAGYAVSPAPVKISDAAAKWIYAGAILLALVIGYGFLGKYPMDWQPVAASASSEVQEVRQELLALGFPAHILDDLTEADILSCKGALRVVVEVRDHPVNDGREVEEEYRDGNEIHTVRSTVYDQKELRLTGIGVELPGQREQWKIIHHFQWVIDPGFRGTEVIHLWPAYYTNRGWVSGSSLSGQVLYTDNGIVYSSPYHFLGQETYTKSSFLWGEQVTTDGFAAFSIPNGVENHRGYVSYTAAEAQDGYIVDSWINYTHQTSRLQYPVITAMQKHLISGVRDTFSFLTLQDALQFYPNQPETE